MARSYDFDARLRVSAFEFLRSVQLRTGGPVRFADVANFTFEGERVPLMDTRRGIRKPAILSAALSFRTVHAARPDLRPYDDSPGTDGCLRYKWRGSDPDHPENCALRTAQVEHLPLIWFQGVVKGVYLPIFPVWLVCEEPDERQFVVSFDAADIRGHASSDSIDPELRRRYALRTATDRLHQPLFRARVLRAYDEKCALCRLRHVELLDAAHIRPDVDGGEPVVPNGIAMCKIHHAAYDANLLGIDPDRHIVIRPDLLDEHDGPTLQHALQGLHQNQIDVPARRNSWPDPSLLAERFARFEESF